MLTRKQYELLMFIRQNMKENGIPPSFEEMKEALGLRSKSGIHRLITALEERGFIRRLPHRARALEIIMGDYLVTGYPHVAGYPTTVYPHDRPPSWETNPQQATLRRLP